MKSSSEIRDSFFTFFREQGHQIIPSAPVVPVKDPTLLFTNAGMNQFKEIFLGISARSHPRVANTQKCIRVSGKHNDLEEVGVDTYHHTFFEMLGNWSFGDYFKREAIHWGWEFLVDRCGLDPNKLYATVFAGKESLGLGPDEEAEGYWPSETGIPPERVLRFGAKDNFWEMGETGPCGPCSEIHIDLGPDACDRQGVPGHTCWVNGDCGRYVEIWNLVFIQYNRFEDGTLKELPAKHVDTGMGLERLVAVMQGKLSNYDTDLFTPLFDKLAELTGFRYGTGSTKHDMAMRVVADHVRALSSAIADGALPGKMGRSYVLRRLLRRAARYGRQVLNMERPFMGELIPVVADIFASTFPEIAERQRHIELTIRDEEEAFAKTIDRGIHCFQGLSDKLSAKNCAIIPGVDAYCLYHQDGFPRDLIDLMAREQGLTVDEEGWSAAELEHKRRSKAAQEKGLFDLSAIEGLPATEFLGYWEREQATKEGTLASAKPLKLLQTHALAFASSPFFNDNGERLAESGLAEAEGFRFQINQVAKHQGQFLHYGEVTQGDPDIPTEVLKVFLFDSGSGTYQKPSEVQVSEVIRRDALILDQTPFYAEAGGQVGDHGIITGPGFQFQVIDTGKLGDIFVHFGHLEQGRPDKLPEEVTAMVDLERRRDIAANHTATHLMHWALKRVLSKDANQHGSLVTPQRLRFDVTHRQAITTDQQEEIERLVNSRIAENTPLQMTVEDLKSAKERGVTALFGEKYGDKVRVITIGQYSQELCGGTHCLRTGDIGYFRIISESASEAGVRRLEALTRNAAIEEAIANRSILRGAARQLGASPAEVGHRIEALQAQVKILKKKGASEIKQDIGKRRRELLAGATIATGIHVIVEQLEGYESRELDEIADALRSGSEKVAGFLAAVTGGKLYLLAFSSKELAEQKRFNASILVREIAPMVDGRGGGRPDFAKGGGTAVDKLESALARARKAIAEALSS